MAERKKQEKLHLLGLPLEEEKRRQLLRDALAFGLGRPAADEAAEAMLEVLGSFSGVFAAPPGELARIPGVGEEAARFVRLILELVRVCMEDRAEGLRRIFDTASAIEAFRPKFLGRKTEAVCLMLLDGRGRMIYNNVLSEGSVTEVPLYIRRLVQLCIEYDAQGVMIAHNHPSGSALPSQNDILATTLVEMALESIDARLGDHIILAGSDTYSFATSGLLKTKRDEVQNYRREELEKARKAERELLNRRTD